MEIKIKLNAELKDAMRSGDEMRKQNVRMVLSAIRLVEVEKGVKLEESGVLAIIQKELKSRVETMEDAKKANRTDLIERAQIEMVYLESFLPEQLSEKELESLIRQAISDTSATGPSDMGKVMKALLPKFQGLAIGDNVSKLVKKLLQQ